MLRHGLSGVGVSRLASQWYCEKKAELLLQHPEIVVDSATEGGIQGHDEVSQDAKPISRQECAERVARKEAVVLQESCFQAYCAGVSVIGIPDLVDFRGGRPQLVLEFKFSRRRNLFMDRRVQCQMYGWLLQQNGYDTSDLCCAVCVIYPQAAGTKEEFLEDLEMLGLLEDVLTETRRARNRLRRPKGASLRPIRVYRDDWVVHVFPYDQVAAEHQLRWSLGYWMQERDAIPTKKKEKCVMCAYNAAGVCSSALGPADSGLRVHQKRGQLVIDAPWGRRREMDRE